MRRRTSLLLLCLQFVFFSAFPINVNANSNITVPADIIRDMERAGLGRWQTFQPVEGTKISLPRPIMCEGCGGISYPDIVNNNHVSCPSCAHPTTNNTLRLVTPKQVQSNGALRIFLPEGLGTSNTTETAVSRAISARLAQFAQVEMVPCPSCSRHNNPNIFRSCYSCGTGISRDQVRPEERATTRLRGSEQMPPPAASESRPRSLRGGVTTPAPAVRVAGTPESGPRTVTPPRAGLTLPRIPRGVVMGAGATALVAGVVVYATYSMQGDNIYQSRGMVEVLSSHEVLIHVPGFPEPLRLTYDENVEDDSIYEYTTLEPYIDSEFVDIWWTRDDGVIQIIPLDLNAAMEGE